MKQPIPFGKYYLLERVNVGGMAEVFQAKAFGVEGFERLVAVKRILPNIAEDKEFIEMFIDEAKIAVQLTHANIAQIFDLGRVDDAYFIALEYIHGKDLRAIFDRAKQHKKPMPLAQACFIIMRVCEGLDYAHNKRDASGEDLNLVHRDVSPQNILVSYEGEVKVIDFGIAKATGKVSKTQQGILKGKFGYMSPEQVRGLPIDRRSDIFSLGIVLYELLTGERLFVGESDFSTLEKVRNVEILPPSTYNRDIPDELERIVFRALAKDVEDRYQNAIELSEDLERFLRSANGHCSRKDLAAWMKQTFAPEIEKESKKLEEYRSFEPVQPQPLHIEDDPPPNVREVLTKPPPLPPQSVPRLPPPLTLEESQEVIEAQPPAWASRPPSTVDIRRGGAMNTGRELSARSVGAMPMLAGPAALAMPAGGQPSRLDWEEELETQIYDRPDEMEAPEQPVRREVTSEVLVSPPTPEQEPMGRKVAPMPMRPVPPPKTPELDWSPSMPVDRPASSERSGSDRVRKVGETPQEGPGRATAFRAPPRRRSLLPYVAAVAAVSAVCVAALVGYTRRSGVITITSFPSDVQVLVGGVVIAKETPVTLTRPPGLYKVVVARDGYATKEYEIGLAAGERVPLHAGLVSLSPDVAFILKSDPPRQKALLDGKELDGETPFKVHDVPPGRHRLEIKGSGCYAPWSQDFTVEMGKPPPEIFARLHPLDVQVQIETDPSDAKIYITNESRRTFYGETPKKLTFDPSKEYVVDLERAGYKPHSEPLHFDGRCELSVAVALERQEGSAAPKPVAHNETPKARKVAHQALKDTSDEEQQPTEAKGSQTEGYLKINTRPWTRISIDGEDTGLTTPQAKMALSPGTHLLTLINPEFGINKTQKVVIEAGETSAVIQRFEMTATEEAD